MFNSRCFVTLSTVIHCLKTITQEKILDSTTPTNFKTFDESLGLLALNYSLGTPQHKRSCLSHMLNHKLNVKTLYELSKHQDVIVTYEPEGPSLNTITELPVAETFLDYFKKDVKNFIVTSDTITTKESWTKQSNNDYQVTITSKLDRLLCIKRLHDCKEGTGIFKHTTRGSLGIITFDGNNNVIQTTSNLINASTLIRYNHERLNGLEVFLKQEGLLHYFEKSLVSCKKHLESCKSIFDTNLVIENILWNEFQCHPKFPRSVSFVFLHKTDFDNIIPDEKFKNLVNHLETNLSQESKNARLFNLDKRGHAKEFFTTLLKGYKKEVDPLIYEKLLHLKNSGINLNTFFNEILHSCMK